MVTNSATNTPTGASGTVLQGQGIGTANAFSTATYPSTATGTGTILRADGTNWSATTATYPNTTTVNQLLYSSATNVVSGLATANRAVHTTNATGVPVATPLATDGQLIIGSTAGAPAAATITAGTNITVTNASNSITIAATGGSSSGTLLTPVVTTSGTTATFSGISAVQANVIYFMLSGVKRNGTNTLQLQIGPSSAITTSGYVGSSAWILNTSTSVQNESTFIYMNTTSDAASVTYSGSLMFTLIDSTNFIYSYSGNIGTNATTSILIGGKIALSGLLDQFKLFLSGANAFNAGEVNVLYYT